MKGGVSSAQEKAAVETHRSERSRRPAVAILGHQLLPPCRPSPFDASQLLRLIEHLATLHDKELILLLLLGEVGEGLVAQRDGAESFLGRGGENLVCTARWGAIPEGYVVAISLKGSRASACRVRRGSFDARLTIENSPRRKPRMEVILCRPSITVHSSRSAALASSICTSSRATLKSRSGM